MKRGYWLVTIVLACALIVVSGLTYKRWPQFFRRATPQRPADQNEFSTVPPFATKEPPRYQATRVVTSTETQAGATTPPLTSTALIARDGEKRREEYQATTNETLVYLDTPAGRFVLLPAKKLYANLDLAARQFDTGHRDSDEASLESLLHETSSASHYENLGAESVNGRSTTKYRVSAGEAANGTAATSVTLIWIDDLLGMPIRSETTSTEGDRATKVVMELRDLTPEVDPQLFVIPGDYRRVDNLGSELKSR